MSTSSFQRQAWRQRCRFSPNAELVAPPAPPAAAVRPAVQRFIDAHRQQGHRCAALDPLGLADRMDPARLAPQRFGLQPGDALTEDGSPLLGLRQVQALDQRLKAIYCGPLALDSSGVRDEARLAWLQARMESPGPAAPAGGTDLLDRLIQAQAWEQHVARRFPHAKRFSLEGCEALLPLLDALIEQAAAQGIGAVFMGMPHRGRVNLLVNLLGMAPAEVLDYFDPAAAQPERHRDLVYHLGAQRRLATRHGELALTLAHNPSHLQSVYPVVTGMAHACQAGAGAPRALALVLHGDAAFAGQGVVMETLMLTQKDGYSVGGTVHVIINNQLGFTEPNPMSARSQRYCTDVARAVDAPVLRVNADAPEQLQRAAEIALGYRQAFGADVVIDLIGYRRLGHSEHDLPAVTSPQTYAGIKHQPSVVERYGQALVDAGLAAPQDMARYIACGRSAALEAFAAGAPRPPEPAPPAAPALPPLTALTRAELRARVAAMTRLPAGFRPHPLVGELIEQWQRLADDDAGSGVADWCFAESMAYATALGAGIDVRVSGLDVGRGTFLHRHAVWHDQASAGSRAFVPLQALGTRARFEIANSVLSEEAVLGFEYGGSVQAPQRLSVWEAQFGDFVNGAQVYIDQYISSGEEKWGCRSALALLLPHGYEGVGPEHSNAYLSRFLQLCGADNMRVACPSTSAQWFHLLRQQAFAPQRKPLVVMTPKAQLYGEAASHAPLAQLLSAQGFAPVLDDPAPAAPAEVRRAILCSGKLFYELERARAAAGRRDLALLRLEQLYPFPQQALAALLQRYTGLRELVWAQEESRNQGAWAFVRDDLAALCPPGVTLREVARPVTAAGACSSLAVHRREQAELLVRALGPAG